MPVEKIDPTNTFRLWVNYNDGFFDHAIMFRYDGSVVTETEVMAVANDYLAAWSSGLHTITIIGAEFAGDGTEVRNAIAWPHAATYGSGTIPDVLVPRYVEFTGKDNTGHRWHLTQFGINVTTPNTFKFVPGNDVHVDAALSALTNAFLANTIYSINKRRVITNNIVPIGYNDHYVVRRRGA